MQENEFRDIDPKIEISQEKHQRKIEVAESGSGISPRIVIVIVVLICAAGSIMLMSAESTPLMPLGQYLADHGQTAGGPYVDLRGFVSSGVKFNEHGQAIFKLRDPTYFGGSNEITVITDQELQNNFETDKGIRIQGRMVKEGEFFADRVIVECEHAYNPETGAPAAPPVKPAS
ncbi:MAG: cytochrome c maturation protein CcmE [Planctomycetes bacterium]|nr:cytochrome c maturation protein CcmE [Planctomycetota bacterium]